MKELFHEIADLPAAERAARLDELSRSDAELHREILSLIEADARSRAPLDTPVAPPEAPLPGQIGPWRVVERIGRGGMGEVYLALRDDEVRLRAAVKVVRGGATSAEIIQRFRNERQILASLEHPNIARLLDGGSFDGVPYFVMEFIEGTPIDRYCRDHGLTVEQRLRLFVDVCAAVQYAHGNLVVHRDIKPSNILVTRDGVPKLLDFGIAKVLDAGGNSAGETATEMRILTPEYASPEQILGQPLATTSDVYSLGLVLYELLTGLRPRRCDSRSPAALAEMLAADIARPSTAVLSAPLPGDVRRSLERRLRGDLDNVVMSALRSDPARRYPSAEALAADIRRHLDGLPVTARPDTFAYRASKFVRRNRGGVAAAVLLLVALGGGFAATVRQANIARAERDRAERRFEDVRALATSLLFEIDVSVRMLPGSLGTRQLLVTRSLDYLRRLSSDTGGDPRLLAELGTGWMRVADIQGHPNQDSLGDYTGALTSLGRGIELYQRALADKPADAATRAQLGKAWEAKAEIEIYTGALNPALASLRQAGLQLRAALRGRPADAAIARDLGSAELLTGDILGNRTGHSLARHREAIASYSRALATERAILSRDPKSGEHRHFTANAFFRLSRALEDTGDRRGARQAIEAALSYLVPLSAEYPHVTFIRRDVAHYRMQLARLVDPPRAVEEFETAIALLDSIAQETTDDETWPRRDLATILANGAELLAPIDPARAVKAADRGSAIFRELAREDAQPLDTGTRLLLGRSWTAFATAWRAGGHPQRALEAARLAVDHAAAASNARPESASAAVVLAAAQTELARCTAAAGERTEAAREFATALAAWSALPPGAELTPWEEAMRRSIPRS